MKNIKKFLLIMAMTMALGTSAFAASGFEFLLNVPFGINVGIPNKETKDMGANDTHIGFDVGVDAQIGYMFQVSSGFGISALAELGYSWDVYGIGYSASFDTSTVRYSINQFYHSFKVGLLPKFNVGVGNGAIAIGIGGGVKIPISGTLRMTVTETPSNTTENNELMKSDTALKRKDITDMFSPSVIGYVKVTLDYYLFFTDNIGMNFGLYLGGDFAPKQKQTKIGGDAFDIGLQLGFRFGPKA